MNNLKIHDSLFGSINWKQFLSECWQKKPWYVDRGQANYFKYLISKEEYHAILDTYGGREDFTVSVMGSHIDAPSMNNARKPKSFWTGDRIREAFTKGATIRIGNTAQYVKAIKQLQQHFEARLHTDVNINLYHTPPNSRAFGAHFDDHDVFIVQISGKKVWKIFSPHQPSPVEVLRRGRSTWISRELPGKTKMRILPPIEKEQELLLEAGDLLYVPRGHVHQVFTQDEESMHLTVAAPVVTWYEVVIHALMETLKTSEGMREALPAGFAEKPFSEKYYHEMIAKVKEELNKNLTPKNMLASLDEMSKRFLITRDPVREEVVESIELSVESKVRIRADMSYRLEETLTEVILYFFGGYVIFPIRASSMLTYILEQKVFVVKNLPTQMTDKSRLYVTEKLIAEGFLEIEAV